jgi:hypothetical protein
VRVVVPLKPYTRKVYAVNKNPIGSLGVNILVEKFGIESYNTS